MPLDQPVTGIGTAKLDDSSLDLRTLLTVEEVAAVLQVSTSWVYEHTRARGTPRSDRLPHVKIGKYVRFDPRALRAFLDGRARRP